MLKLLKPETRENVRENVEEETENETRSFYTPTKSVRINSTQNNDTNTSRNNNEAKTVPLRSATSIINRSPEHFSPDHQTSPFC